MSSSIHSLVGPQFLNSSAAADAYMYVLHIQYVLPKISFLVTDNSKKHPQKVK